MQSEPNQTTILGMQHEDQADAHSDPVILTYNFQLPTSNLTKSFHSIRQAWFKPRQLLTQHECYCLLLSDYSNYNVRIC